MAVIEMVGIVVGVAAVLALAIRRRRPREPYAAASRIRADRRPMRAADWPELRLDAVVADPEHAA